MPLSNQVLLNNSSHRRTMEYMAEAAEDIHRLIDEHYQLVHTLHVRVRSLCHVFLFPSVYMRPVSEMAPLQPFLVHTAMHEVLTLCEYFEARCTETIREFGQLLPSNFVSKFGVRAWGRIYVQ